MIFFGKIVKNKLITTKNLWKIFVAFVENGEIFVTGGCSLLTNPFLTYLCSLKEFGPNRCVVSFSKLLGKLIIEIASNGHFFIIFNRRT